MGIKITNLNVSYDPVTGDVIGYNVNVNGTEDSINASFTLSPDDVDLTSILEVCKQKLQEAVTKS